MKTTDTDLFELVEESAVDAAPFYGIHPGVAQDFIQSVLDRCRMRVGGTECYVGKCDKARRNQTIKDKFNGHNLNALAAEHHLSPRQIRNILKQK